MKKTLWIIAGIAVLGIAGFGAYSLSSAQSPEPPNAKCPPRVFHFWVAKARSLCVSDPAREGIENGQKDPAQNPLHKYMKAAVAEVLGITEDELDAMRDNKGSLRAYIKENGITIEKMHELMLQARGMAIDNALEDGAINDELAEKLKTRLEFQQDAGFKNLLGKGKCRGNLPNGLLNLRNWKQNQESQTP